MATKVKVNVNGSEIEQYAIRNSKEVKSYFKEFPKMDLLNLKDAFQRMVNNNETVIIDTEKNMAGFYSWRTAGVDNWNIL